MTHPISNERIEFLQARHKVVSECIRIAQSEMYALSSGGAQRDDLSNALKHFNTEYMAIAIELRALTKFGVTP